MEYVGDIFTDGSGGGYGGMMMAAEGDGASLALDEADPPIRVGQVFNLSGKTRVGQVSKVPGNEAYVHTSTYTRSTYADVLFFPAFSKVC